MAAADARVLVVGGVCGVLHGAPVTTFDLDLVHLREAGNVERLLGVLRGLDAHYRGHRGRRLEPDRAGLMGPGHHLLLTSHGPLDILGTIGDGATYESLLPESDELQLGDGLTVRVLGLEALIRTKEQTGRAKDLAVLAVLRAVLAEKHSGGGG